MVSSELESVWCESIFDKNVQFLNSMLSEEDGEIFRQNSYRLTMTPFLFMKVSVVLS